ncbi:MAG TPA: PIG-L family deacetylase [Tepidisphaeraceae bacterium]|nr:PIG-L family deacetylase [Tepidisphaeraceae bacterium]
MDTCRSSDRSPNRYAGTLGRALLGALLLINLLAGSARAAAASSATSATTPAAASSSSAPSAPSAAAILQDLRTLRQTGSVLYVAAHPDDENTHLITYLARGRGYRTAYLSLTRGDGGQNVIGPEFDAALGLIRTHELLAARRLDKGRQFFTRALDFGFSKDYRETLKFWDRQQVVGDIVRVIRTFRPDVVVTRFSPEPGGTHGHHTASAVLAVEAFRLAGDAGAFPEQLGTLAPWQPKRIVQNGRGGGGMQIDVGGSDPVLGDSFARIAGRSRGMHKSQGFGDFGGGGGGGGGGGPRGGGGAGDRAARPESFQLLAGEPANKDLLDGIDTTWARFPGGADAGPMIDETIAKFDEKEPSASAAALLELRRKLAALPADLVIDEKRRDLDRILCACLGLSVETAVPHAEVVPGETIKLRHSVSLRSSVPVRWVGVRYPKINRETTEAVELRRDQPAVRESTQTLPPDSALTQPYWLREEGTAGMSRVDDASLIGLPENPPAFPIEHVFEVSDQTLIVADEPVQAAFLSSNGNGQAARLEIIPPVSLEPLSEVRLFSSGGSKPVEVEVIASRAGAAGTVALEAPQGWKIEPASQPFKLSAAGERAKVSFTVTAPQQHATASLTAVADVNGARFNTRRVEIRYPHIPPLLLQPRARVRAVSVDLALGGKRRVGYLPGAGDSVADHLAEMGYAVTPLTGADLTPEKLRKLDAVVVGVRALNVRTDLGDRMPALFAFAEAGGNVIVQYNRPDGLKANPIAPYPLKLSRERVTDEASAVALLAPNHPALNAPNKIAPADFDGWVQERGLYYPSEWAPQFMPILAAGDAGEKPLEGGLLIAKHGRGHFVYTGLAWFRQLPAGVPGAYRLFANLVSLGS